MSKQMVHCPEVVWEGFLLCVSLTSHGSLKALRFLGDKSMPKRRIHQSKSSAQGRSVIHASIYLLPVIVVSGLQTKKIPLLPPLGNKRPLFLFDEPQFSSWLSGILWSILFFFPICGQQLLCLLPWKLFLNCLSDNDAIVPSLISPKAPIWASLDSTIHFSVCLSIFASWFILKHLLWRPPKRAQLDVPRIVDQDDDWTWGRSQGLLHKMYHGILMEWLHLKLSKSLPAVVKKTISVLNKVIRIKLLRL